MRYAELIKKHVLRTAENLEKHDSEDISEDMEAKLNANIGSLDALLSPVKDEAFQERKENDIENIQNWGSEERSHRFQELMKLAGREFPAAENSLKGELS